ncbi:ImmA/IrrE family metallo-endopeptidase [Cupriavidus sp. AcVe19-6a]|uniref:ImmA/IrrE family metallo-endopeptidase n=1 Tax=Cupriavidus sp. AcVe19-6a TaxID=2821358 RepID=UPI001FD85EA0|nr:ImmA/IrrE family metallo-endopeptidase [Cupriavidus sp. AcVe19-6a]
MDLSVDEFADLLTGKFALTASVATRLEAVLGASAAFWLRREEQYREQLAELAEGVDPESADYKAWLKCLPIKQMVEFGWIDGAVDKRTNLRKCLEFFGVPNLDAWNRTYGETRDAAAFRTTDAHVESVPATAAWLRRGEVLADRIDCSEWNPALFGNQLSKVRELTLLPNPVDFLPRLQHLCAEAGVAVVIVKAPPGCRASGATFFSTPTKAVLLLSFRYLSDDQFWFSFFHEAGHLVLHYDTESLILETTTDGPKSPMEEEANQFAAEHLIPQVFQQRMPEAAKSKFGIARLARDAGVSMGIVVGQMQHRGLLKREHFNKLKTRYTWG